MHTSIEARIEEIANNHKNIIVKENNLLQIEGDIPLSINIPMNGNILVISKDQSHLTHGVHKFPAKFFPELPRYLIRKYSKEGNWILDPMCGSGTAVLEAILQNRNAIGIDIDLMAKLLTKVKTTPLNKYGLLKTKKWVSETIHDCSLNIDFKPKIPEFNYRDNWFKPFILHELGVIKYTINGIMEDDFFRDFSLKQRKDLYDFFNVIFSSIIRDISNADPHCTRTVIRKKLNKNLKRGDAYRNFYKNLNRQTKQIIKFSDIFQKLKHKKVKIPKKCDAKNTKLTTESVDLVVTSPPYINAVDYPRTHQLEMYWLELAKGSLSGMKRRYIGTEIVYSKEYRELKQIGYPLLDSLLSDIYEKDPRRSYIIFKFFKDMKDNLIEMHRVLKPRGRYCIIIGNNTIRDINIPSHQIIMEIANDPMLNYRIENYFNSGLINHFIKIPRWERMHGEWVIILQKG